MSRQPGSLSARQGKASAIGPMGPALQMGLLVIAIIMPCTLLLTLGILLHVCQYLVFFLKLELQESRDGIRISVFILLKTFLTLATVVEKSLKT